MFKAIFISGLLCLTSPPGLHANSDVNTRFTDFFISASSSSLEATLQEYANTDAFRERASKWASAALESVPTLNHPPQDRAGMDEGIQRVVEPNTLFIRGILSRADLKNVIHFASVEYVLSTSVTLEFFDLVSGKVFYTRSLTGQSFKEMPNGQQLDELEMRDLFETCFKATVEGIVQRIGEDYQPGVLEGHVVDVLDSTTVVLDIGRNIGVYQGLTMYLFEDASRPPSGMIKTNSPQEKLSLAKVVILQSGTIRSGWKVRSYGINRLNSQKSQTRYIVAGFNSASPENLPKEFKVDAQDMGQWLHDGLSRNSDLFMLAPLLARLDSSGSVEIQEAIWNAQMSYSIFGSVSQSAMVGRRAFPDVMVNGVLTYAEIQTFLTPGAENKILTVGISVEFYDRTTRDFLYAHHHSGTKVEKIVREGGKTYRDLNLEASFRELCKTVIREASQKIGEHYRPTVSMGTLSLDTNGNLRSRFSDDSAKRGELFNIMQEIRRVTGVNGEDLGPLWKSYGIVRLINETDIRTFQTKVLVSDGETETRAGDRLIAHGKRTGAISGPLSQVSGWHVKGKKVSPEYIFSPGRLTEWLHTALLSTGKFKLLPPDFREGDAETAEIALTSGEFEARDQGEVIYQGEQSPEILIHGRLGLADVQRKTGEFKDILRLRTGLEITITNADGDTLLTKKLAGSRKLEQIKSKGEVAIGVRDLSPEFDGLTLNTIRELVARLADEYNQ